MEGGKPADVLLSRGVILFRGEEIQCRTRIIQSIRRVVAADNEVIPPYSEKLIDVYIQRFEDDEGSFEENFLVSPAPSFSEDYPLCMAKCLLDVKGQVTSKLRVLNPYKTEAFIRKYSNIAEAEECTPIETILETEDAVERQNNCILRQINIAESTDSPPVEDTSPELVLTKLPLHLRDLYEKTREGRSDIEKRQIFAMLMQYQHCFSKHEDDIGRTNLIDHQIDTKEVKPIKQPPRRVPLAFAEAGKE